VQIERAHFNAAPSALQADFSRDAVRQIRLQI
jgi:hypothetical protein